MTIVDILREKLYGLVVFLLVLALIGGGLIGIRSFYSKSQALQEVEPPTVTETVKDGAINGVKNSTETLRDLKNVGKALKRKWIDRKNN